MWIVDAIERLAPRLARYPGPARALFATTFVAVIFSVGLYAVVMRLGDELRSCRPGLRSTDFVPGALC